MSKKSKTPSKRRNKHAAGSTAIESSTSSEAATVESLPQLLLGDWFDRWPHLLVQRWPESFLDISLAEAGFRMEESVDDDGTLIVRGELPGLDPESDVTITIVDDDISIAGKREDRSDETTNGTRRSEFRYGSFHRSRRLPVGARRDEITATYTKGILEVRVPVDAEPASANTIPITTSD
ncbi:MAG: Hsp20/alpha crystallin family protein [Ilumatobacter sp.]|uniref:Hsp20/alpha crystallin family protein n=1 Tax=Ilumatobacter sp. TaxID=1967498 RepID=UPI003297BA83